MEQYRTIIMILIQGAVALGYISQSDKEATTEAIYAIIVATTTLYGIYYKIQANRRENKLKAENEFLFMASQKN